MTFPLHYNTITGDMEARQIRSGMVASGGIQSGGLGAGAVVSGNIQSGSLPGDILVSAPVFRGPLIMQLGQAGIAGQVLLASGLGEFLIRSGNAGGIGLVTLRANATINSNGVIMVSGPSWGFDIDPAADAVRIGRGAPNPAGSAHAIANVYVFGSGGAVATSGFWALSSFFGSGQVGPFHLRFLAPAGAAPDWGAVAFFNAASGAWFMLQPGTSGQRLTTRGSGFDPAWAA